MEEMKDEEKLAVLGFSDPLHSLSWYRERFVNLPTILEDFIVDTLNQYGTFPKDIGNLATNILCHQYYLFITVSSGKYFVKISDTDRGEVIEEHAFRNAKDAAKFLIKESYSASGSIKQYWKN